MRGGAEPQQEAANADARTAGTYGSLFSQSTAVLFICSGRWCEVSSIKASPALPDMEFFKAPAIATARGFHLPHTTAPPVLLALT